MSHGEKKKESIVYFYIVYVNLWFQLYLEVGSYVAVMEQLVNLAGNSCCQSDGVSYTLLEKKHSRGPWNMFKSFVNS